MMWKNQGLWESFLILKLTSFILTSESFEYDLYLYIKLILISEQKFCMVYWKERKIKTSFFNF